MQNKLIIIIAIVFSSCKTEKTAPVDYDNLPAYAIAFNKKDINANEELLIRITQSQNEFQEALIVIDNGIQSLSKKITAKEKTVFKLAARYFRHSGVYNVYIIKGDSILSSKNLQVKPLESNKELEILTGPKTINADNNDQSMIVAIASDKFNNSVEEGTLIKYDSKLLGENNSSITNAIKNQLSHLIVQSTQNATTEFIGISHNNISSNEQRVDFVSGWPSNISISNGAYHPFANNRSFTTIKTNILSDSNNNKIADGTIILFQVKDKFGKYSFYNSIVIDGIATVHIKNPSQANEYYVKALVSSRIESNELKLSYNHDLREILVKRKGNTLIVGPLIGQLGQFISDGSQVEMKIDKQIKVEEALNGYASFNLRELKINKGEKLIISVAGKKKLITLK